MIEAMKTAGSLVILNSIAAHNPQAPTKALLTEGFFVLMVK